MLDLPTADTATAIEAFQRDGAAGIERNMRQPGPLASNLVQTGQSGGFFDDYCNWQRIPEFVRTVQESPAARLAARCMRSESAQLFHDHVLVKEPGTQKATPWHNDLPYYFLDGVQTVSFWIPVDPVKTATLRLIAGSHRWERQVRPETRSSSTIARCTVRAATRRRFGHGCCLCGGSVTMCAMPNGRVEHPRPFRDMEWCPVSVCARIGFRSSGRESRHPTLSDPGRGA